MGSLKFSVAGEDDWPGIWKIFQQIVSTGDTYPYLSGTSENEAIALWMRRDDPREATYVAELDGSVVGTAYVKANSPGLGDHIANAGWMVAPEYQRWGIGRIFAEWVIDQARTLGYHGMQFNSVVSTNQGAIELWASLGFEIVGTVPDAFRHASVGLVPVHVMYRRL